MALVAPGSIHDVLNPHQSPAVSIHAYWPPLRRMTFFAASPDGGLHRVREAFAGDDGWSES